MWYGERCLQARGKHHLYVQGTASSSLKLFPFYLFIASLNTQFKSGRLYVLSSLCRHAGMGEKWRKACIGLYLSLFNKSRLWVQGFSSAGGLY